MQTKSFIAALVVIAALIMLNEWRSADVVAPGPALAPPAAPALQQEARRALAPAAAPEGRQARPNVSGAMARRFNAASSLRAFLYEAMRKPDQGGHHYAFLTLATCSHAHRSPQATRHAERAPARSDRRLGQTL